MDERWDEDPKVIVHFYGTCVMLILTCIDLRTVIDI